MRRTSRLLPAFAALLTVVVTAQQPPPSAPEGPKTTVRGRVVDAATGAAVRGAQATIERGRSGSKATGQADHEGRFVVEEAPSGTQRIQVFKSGYAAYSRQIAVPADGVDDVVLGLDRLAVITGRVTDRAGRPVIGARVTASYRRYYFGSERFVPEGQGRDGMRRSSTDDRGYYRIWDLPARSYWVSVDAQPAPGPSGVARLTRRGAFYPGVARREEASKVTVDWGRVVEGVDFVLDDAPRTLAAGVVLGATPGQGCETCSGGVLPEGAGAGAYLLSVRPNDEGAVVVEGLPTGRYGLVMRSFNRRTSSMEFGSTWFDVTAGRTEEFVVQMAGEQPLTGRVVVEGEPQEEDESEGEGAGRPKMIHVTGRGDPGDPLAPNGSRGGRASISAAGAGPFEFEMSLLPGRSLLQVRMPTRSAYLKTVRLEGRDLGTDRIDVPVGGLKNVEIVMSYEAGSVSGTVKGDGEGDGTSSGPLLPPRESVWLVPLANDASRFARRLSGGIQPDGSFTVEGVPPGRYVAYAVPTLPGYFVEDPEIQAKLRGYGETVEVRAGQATDVTLKTAPRFDELP